jgi:DNA gyrase subunit A
MSRNTQGVRLIKLTKGENLVGIERIVEDKEDEEAAASTNGPAAQGETGPE